MWWEGFSPPPLVPFFYFILFYFSLLFFLCKKYNTCCQHVQRDCHLWHFICWKMPAGIVLTCLKAQVLNLSN